MHPWVAEQMVGNRMAERERAGTARRRSPGSRARPAPIRPDRRPRKAARLVGSLLIGAGRRLAGPDALSAALDASRVDHGRYVA
jgi:hypothetical protein